MAYATLNDVLRRYTPLVSMLGTGSLQITSEDISSVYIADAEGIINLYLGSRYVTPLVSDPAITDLCSDIAIYRVLADKAPRIPDFMQARYTNATSILSMIRDGQMTLGTNSGQQVVTSGGDEFAWSNNTDDCEDHTVFHRAHPCDDFNHFDTGSRFGY